MTSQSTTHRDVKTGELIPSIKVFEEVKAIAEANQKKKEGKKAYGQEMKRSGKKRVGNQSLKHVHRWVEVV
eukprot:3563750-Karenia_brevis.AAC.1